MASVKHFAINYIIQIVTADSNVTVTESNGFEC